MSEVKTLDELSVLISRAKAKSKKVVLCHGVFDLLHPGHLKHFKAAKKLGDILVVTVTQDKYVNKGPGRPVYTEELRAEFIAALECVDYVAINRWPTAEETIRLLKPDIYVKGTDYSDASKDITNGISLEQKTIEDVGGRIHFTDEITFSSSSLLNQHFDIYPEPVQKFLDSFRKRYSADQVVEYLKGLKNVRALIIGETILDEYHHVFAIGKPPKGNHIAARYLRQEVHAGGILACANNMAGFCKDIDLVTVIGSKDDSEKFVREHLRSNVHPFFLYQDRAIIKRRYVDHAYSNKLFEIYKNEEPPSEVISRSISEQIIKNVSGIFGHYDLVLVLDYGHNLFDHNLIKTICGAPHFLAVNAQTNTSNLGYNLITKYPRANYFCLDEPELRLAYQDRYGDINKLIHLLGQRISSPGMVSITRGHLGVVTFDPQSNRMFQAPSFSKKIVDTTGAGDAFLAVTAPCVAKQFPMEIVAFVGNAVGALAVGYLGNQSFVDSTMLFKFITAMLK